MIKDNIGFLKIPLNKLYYIEDVNDFTGFDKEALDEIAAEYEPEEIEGILSSLEWASKHPEYDFSSILPDLEHSNTDIFEYISKAYGSLKNITEKVL